MQSFDVQAIQALGGAAVAKPQFSGTDGDGNGDVANAYRLMLEAYERNGAESVKMQKELIDAATVRRLADLRMFKRTYGAAQKQEVEHQAAVLGLPAKHLVNHLAPGANPLRSNVLMVGYEWQALNARTHLISAMISKSRSVIDKLASNN
jgi:hypothetical protein